MNDTVYVEDTPPRSRQQRPAREEVVGWGADLDPADRPAYPKERTPPRLDVPYERPAEQENHHHIEVFHSTERPGRSPVWGTSSPPRGLSGVMRRFAYRFSENDVRHWLMLLAADRVDVGEGLLEDLAHGHVPNLFKEMGGPAEWRYNRDGFIRKAAIAGVVVGAAYLLLRRRR